MSLLNDACSMSPAETEPVPSSRSGKRTVLLMFGFGILMVSMLWLYWELYTRPFRPLQNAIAAAYPGCRPSVIGGRYKSHQPGSPNVLRIVLLLPEKSDFDPQVDREESQRRSKALARLAASHVALDTYDLMEIHLVLRPPEQQQRISTISHPIEEWRRILKEPD